VLAYELAHVRQQNEGAVSMLPQENMELEVDPDPALEREAEETAQQVTEGGELGIQRLADTEVHVQRAPKHEAVETLALLELENESEESDISEFRESQNQNRIAYLREAVTEFHQAREEMAAEVQQKGTIEGRLYMKEQIEDLNAQMEERLEDVALTDDQRQKLESGINTGAWADLGTPIAAFVVSQLLTPIAGLATGVTLVSLKNWFGSLDGDIAERMEKLTTKLEEQGKLTGEGDSTGDVDMDVGYEQ